MRINKGIIIQKTGKNLTIFDGEKSVLYTFNESASFIFKRLKRGFNKANIIKSMTKKYGVDEFLAENDYEKLINKLKDKNIVK